MAEYITGKIKLSSVGGIMSYADSNPIPIADENGRDGWLWTKTTEGSTDYMNLYFYSQGNRPITLGEIHSINAVLSIDSYTNTYSLPTLNIYTKPTGVGDAGAWYHSRINHLLKAGETIILGEIIEAWGIKKDAKQGNTRQVNFNEQIRLGDCLESEEILTMSLIMPTDSPLWASVLVENLGYTLTNGVRIGLAQIV